MIIDFDFKHLIRKDKIALESVIIDSSFSREGTITPHYVCVLDKNTNMRFTTRLTTKDLNDLVLKSCEPHLTAACFDKSQIENPEIAITCDYFFVNFVENGDGPPIVHLVDLRRDDVTNPNLVTSWTTKQISFTTWIKSLFSIENSGFLSILSTIVADAIKSDKVTINK
jgi:hypothetical protein